GGPWLPPAPVYYGPPPAYVYPPPPLYDCGTWEWNPQTHNYTWLRCAPDAMGPPHPDMEAAPHPGLPPLAEPYSEPQMDDRR
ncbi:MAG: hypothetical protein ABW042_03385, partial [Phenylobacterium sp.]